jgi:hypothetical protein
VGRAITAVVLALSLSACGLAGPSGEPVQLLTYDGAGDSCYTNAAPRLLVADPQAGTAVLDSPDSDGPRTRVAWPSGSVGRRVGSEVAVYSGSGKLVATTGKYWFMAETPGDYSDPTQAFKIGCADRALDWWDPSASPPPG